MADTYSIFLEVDSGFAFAKNMNCDLINLSNSESFTKRSANLTMKNFCPENIIVQTVRSKEKFVLNIQKCTSLQIGY